MKLSEAILLGSTQLLPLYGYVYREEEGKKYGCAIGMAAV